MFDTVTQKANIRYHASHITESYCYTMAQKRKRKMIDTCKSSLEDFYICDNVYSDSNYVSIALSALNR